MKNALKVSIFALFMWFAPAATFAQVSVGLSVRIGPPALPVYVQPPCPVDGYLWTPGYWAYDDADGYYWVPGAWVAPPDPGYLWTPGYWGYDDGFYRFHRGYWGLHVGYYGGINYGFGYIGSGFVGGGWYGGHFRYNTAVVRVNTTVIHNTYVDRNVIRNAPTTRTSFNGPGGVRTQPRPQERAAMNEHHINPTSQQVSHQTMASHDRSQFASANHGTPHTAAVPQVSNRSFGQQNRTPNGAAPHQANGFGNHNATPHTQMSGPPAQQHTAPAQQHNGGFGQHQQTQPQQQQPQHQQPQMQRPQAQPQHQAPPQQQHQQPQAQPQRQPAMQPRGGFGQPHGGGGGGSRPAGGGGGGRPAGGHGRHG